MKEVVCFLRRFFFFLSFLPFLIEKNIYKCIHIYRHTSGLCCQGGPTDPMHDPGLLPLPLHPPAEGTSPIAEWSVLWHVVLVCGISRSSRSRGEIVPPSLVLYLLQ